MAATECQGHKHAGKCPECGKDLIELEKFGTIHDDGSVCDKVVQPVKPKYSAERVLGLFMAERDDLEVARRRAGKKD